MNPIYLDNQATTKVDPRVVEAMLPCFTEVYGNAGSLVHEFGEAARELADSARARVASCLGAESSEIVVTSGATESNNLALLGVALHPLQRRRRIVSVETEHHAVLDPLQRLEQQGFEVARLPVRTKGHSDAGIVDLERFKESLDDQTALVTVMLANNEIGAIQPLAEMATLSHEVGALVHSDATQGVGKLPVDVREMGVDLLSFSAHKMYGPKGVGGLYVRGGRPRIRLLPQLLGGGQESARRSGTLNVPGLVGMARALELCVEEMEVETSRTRDLRDRLWRGLNESIESMYLNGPDLSRPDWRLAGNLNVQFAGVDGQALMMANRAIAVSSGAACTSSDPRPSHVLGALGLNDDEVRSSLRFGLGRFNTAAEIDEVVRLLSESVVRLRKLGA